MGWIIAGTFALISTIASIWLINKHLQWYTNVRPQFYRAHLSPLLTTFTSESSKDVRVLLVAIRYQYNNIYRYRAAFVYGPHLRFDQFCIVLVLGEKNAGQLLFSPTESCN